MTSSGLTAVVLAAGEGRRLEPLTNRRPKPMLPIVNRPLLEHVVEAVAAAGIDDVVLVVGYERDRIQTHFGDGDDWGISIRYAVQETQLGTGHALLEAEDHVDGPFLVLNGDRIIDPSIVEAVRDAVETGESAVMATTRSAEPERYGVVTVAGDRVVGLVEKPQRDPPSTLINAGVYGFRKSIFDLIRETDLGPDGELELTRALEPLFEDERVRAIRYDGRWLDVTHLWDILAVSGRVLDDEGGASAGAVDERAAVASSTHVAADATIGPNATVGRSVTIAENARVGANAVVERSVVFPDATVGPGAVVRDAIVSENAHVGANVTVPGGEATVVVDGVVHDEIRLGGVVGDNARVGGGAVLEPGAVLHDDVDVGTGAVARGSIDRNTTVRRG